MTPALKIGRLQAFKFDDLDQLDALKQDDERCQVPKSAAESLGKTSGTVPTRKTLLSLCLHRTSINMKPRSELAIAFIVFLSSALSHVSAFWKVSLDSEKMVSLQDRSNRSRILIDFIPDRRT